MTARMTLALEMFFDPAGDTAVRGLWDRLEQAGVSSLATASHQRHHLHVSLAVAQRLVVGGPAPAAVRGLAGTELSLPVLGAFFGEEAVLFLGVTVTAALLHAHAAIHSGIERASEGVWDLYRPGRWVPHCTLAMHLATSEFAAAFACLRRYSPINVRVDQVNMVEIETGQSTPVA